ncbi:tyrosine-type recombinase/integrase [Nitratidesulfovibrio vulgaris]|uniref:tyrosine-type recombinase/integrase n=1 Tax=Nitratidesulfovibrio vulgaris TaxID=881 RepID=UPI0023008B19|nr:tyrosine-type recombinase/integrase [Nitratidesulfovibrio vulgaris]WCB45742.1 tyrosine-type recombinase/integrase [Nitratidesulfovibrio vulgaris]
MADDKQTNERRATRFEGVYQRPARKKKYEGKPDVTYTIDYYDPHTGKRVRKTIGNRSEGITAEYAKSVRQKLMSEAKIEVLEGIVPMAAKGVPTLHDAWQKYKRDWLEANGKPSTYNDTIYYNKYLEPSDINLRPLNKITVRDLEKIANTMREKGYAPQTIKTTLALVRRIMNKAAKWKMWRGLSPFQDFEMPLVDNERTRYFTEEQMQQVFKMLRERDLRAWLMSLISLQCGLRFSEIAKLELNDINIENNTLFIRHPKNGQSRYVAMTQTVRDALTDWLAASHTSPVFPTAVGKKLWNMDDDFRKAVDELGLNDGISERRDRITFDCLRQVYVDAPVVKEQKRIITDEEIDMILERLKERSHRTWLMSIISLGCGLRFSEIADLEINDVNFTDNTLRFQRPRNGRVQYASMTTEVQDALKKWVEANKTSIVFQSAAGTKLYDMDEAFKEVVDELGFNQGAVRDQDKITFDLLRQARANAHAANKEKRTVTEEQVLKILAQIKKRSGRAWLISLISLECGLKFSEIAKLESHDIDFENNTLRFRRPKRGPIRYAPLSQPVRDALIDWFAENHTSLVFPNNSGGRLTSMDRVFKKIIDELGLNDGVTENRDRLVFHSLRHTYASFLAKENYSELTLAKLLGHKSTEMTRRYSHLMPSTQQAIAAHVEKVIPINMEHRASLT